jgi:hypothetical protein
MVLLSCPGLPRGAGSDGVTFLAEHLLCLIPHLDRVVLGGIAEELQRRLLRIAVAGALYEFGRDDLTGPVLEIAAISPHDPLCNEQAGALGLPVIAACTAGPMTFATLCRRGLDDKRKASARQ